MPFFEQLLNYTKREEESGRIKEKKRVKILHEF